MSYSRVLSQYFFFFNDTATTEIYTLSLHDALPISVPGSWTSAPTPAGGPPPMRSEEHTSELQSRENLVCRLLLEKKKKIITPCVVHHYKSYTCRRIEYDDSI